MTITNDVVRSQPVLKSVNLSLTPREAYLLALVVGNLNETGIYDAVKNWDVDPPRFSLNDASCCKHKMTREEVVVIMDFYKNVMDNLVAAHGRGEI